MSVMLQALYCDCPAKEKQQHIVEPCCGPCWKPFQVWLRYNLAVANLESR
jgi:hypothetical protein